MAPFLPYPGFGGHAWIFRPILEDAVKKCLHDDFTQEQLMKEIRDILENHFLLYPTLANLPDITLWEMKLWLLEDIPSDFDPQQLPTTIPTSNDQSFECFIPFSSAIAKSSKKWSIFL